MSSPARLLTALVCAALPLAWAEPARADASSWAFAGAGALAWKQGAVSDYTVSGAMQLDVGVGTRPDAPVIVGGLFRVMPIFGSGADLGLLLRGATRGFQGGGIGVALDAGGYARFWGEGSQGFLGSFTIGAPLGFTLTLQGGIGTDSARAFGAVAGFDFLRMTVYRQTLLEDWPNPFPSQLSKTREQPGRARF